VVSSEPLRASLAHAHRRSAADQPQFVGPHDCSESTTAGRPRESVAPTLGGLRSPQPGRPQRPSRCFSVALPSSGRGRAHHFQFQRSAQVVSRVPRRSREAIARFSPVSAIGTCRLGLASPCLWRGGLADWRRPSGETSGCTRAAVTCPIYQRPSPPRAVRPVVSWHSHPVESCSRYPPEPSSIDHDNATTLRDPL
jgi:hypothetical protein